MIKASNLLTGSKQSKPDSPVRGKAKASLEQTLNASRPKLVSSTARQKYANYPSEDIACIQRNTQRALKRERTPSTDSAPEISVPEKKKPPVPGLKKRGRPPLNASKAASTDTKKAVGASETAPKLLSRLSQETKQKNSTNSTSQHIEKQSQAGNKVKPQESTVQHSNLDSKKLVNSRIETKRVNPRSLRPPISQSDSPGYCDSCQQEFVYLQWHLQTKHKIVYEENTLVTPKPKLIPKGRYKSTGRARKCVSNSGESMMTLPVNDGEAERIARTVQGDVLIQQFGVRLLGMSLSPQQKVLAVAARMVELVRLLRAAQGLEPGVQSLTHLLHTQHWPLITESILYVAGFQQQDGSFRNPAFVFDIGQALKFCAYILKNEAAMNMNQPYEQQLKDFMNSIDAKINEILPGSFELRHMLETEDNLSGKTVTEKSEEITAQTTAMLSNFNENAQSSTQVLSSEEILPELLDVSEIGQVTDSPDFVAAAELVAMTCKPQESPEKGEGERQASLLLGLSKAFTSNISETKTSAENPSEEHPQISLPDLIESEVAGQTHRKSNLDSSESSSDEMKLSPANSNLNLRVNDPCKSDSTKVRFVKIVSANSKNTLGQINKRKFCLLIPSQTVQNKSTNEKVCEPTSLQTDTLQSLSELHGEGEMEGIHILPSSEPGLDLDATCSMQDNGGGSVLTGSEDGLMMASHCDASQPVVSGISELTEPDMVSSHLLEPRQSLANLCGLTLDIEET